MVKLKWLFIGIMMLGHGVFYGQTRRYFFDDVVPAGHYKNTLAVSMQLVAELEDCDDSKVAERIALLGALVQVLRAQEQQGKPMLADDKEYLAMIVCRLYTLYRRRLATTKIVDCQLAALEATMTLLQK